MPQFRFDPVSLVLEIPNPELDALRERSSENGPLEVVDFNGRYLHERVHWIQHFSTFSGLIQVFNAELQQFILEQTMSRLAKCSLPSVPPLLATWNDDEGIQAWKALELFGAAMAGDRTKTHFETSYGPQWPTRLLQGAQLFSQNINILRANEFRFDGQIKTEYPGVSVRKATLLQDETPFVVGSSLLFELHAGLAQLAYLHTRIGQHLEYTVDPVGFLPRRVVELRDDFLDKAKLPNDWRGDMVCSIAAYLALNSPVAPFFPFFEKKKSLAHFNPVPSFMELARKLAPLRAKIAREPYKDVFEFHAFALELLSTCAGPDFYQVNLKLLGMAVSAASYRPLGLEDRKVLSFENDRPQYIAATARRLVDIARKEPIFVTCPGHLYTLDRKRFGELYALISHPLEYRHEVGLCPSPHLTNSPDLLEYARQVAFALKAELCRALVHADLTHSVNVVGRYRNLNSHPVLRELHTAGLQAGLNDLVLPADVKPQIVRALGLETGRAPSR